jgi:predicted HicB family RNase H-like nuclease
MTKYKTPKEYPRKEAKRSLSARIKVSSWDYLSKQAAKNGQSVGELVEYVVEDYIEWLKKNA